MERGIKHLKKGVPKISSAPKKVVSTKVVPKKVGIKKVVHKKVGPVKDAPKKSEDGSTNTRNRTASKTAILPTPSQQKTTVSCCVDAVGKAVTKLIDKKKKNVSQESVIDELMPLYLEINEGKTGEDSTIFDGKEIGVTDETGKQWKALIKVKTTGLGFENEDWEQDFTLPRKAPYIDEDCKEEMENDDSEMVLRW